MTGIRSCAIVGAGVIGAGWAARFLLNGLDVAVFDPQPGCEARVLAVLANAERAQARLTSARRKRGTLRFASTIAEAVEDSDLIQESAPEREDLKHALLQEIDALAPSSSLICSSTSGLLPTRLQAGLRHPGRFVIGHPFNPVYLLPLVEVCAGAATDASSVQRAMAFYEWLGMKPLHVRHEIDGFIADRLLEALWREALWLVHDGVATTAEIDDAIRFGAGLRWSFMGTFLTYRLAGGPAGMRHFLAQFGPALQLPWTKLMDVPEMTDAFVDEIARQSDEQAAGLDLQTLERKRDDCLVAVMQALKLQEFGAGAVLASYEAQLAPAPTPDTVAAPLRLYGGTVPLDWVDYNRHMTESRYLGVFSAATDALLHLIGAGPDYVATGYSYYTAETHIVHCREIASGQEFATTTEVIGGDEKRLHLFHRMHHAATGDLLATGEHMLVHVDMGQGRSVPAPDQVVANLTALRDAHAALPRPPQVGRAIALRGSGGAPSPALSRLVDSEVAAFIAKTESFYPASTNAAGPAENRATYDRMCAAFRADRPPGVTVTCRVLAATGPDRTLSLRHYASAPSDVTLLYLHGGGFVVGGLDSHDDVCAELCSLAGIEVVALDYRLAPEHPYPAALDDAEAAFAHLLADGRRVIVGGDSAGGNLTAALCLRRKRLGGAMPEGQVLIYPGLGGDPYRNGERNLDAPLLPVRESGSYRRMYAGGATKLPRNDPEFAPLCATDATALPQAAIFSAGIDPLRQDAEDFAALLAASGVATLYRNDPGLVHGYLRARHASRVARRAFAAIADALRMMAESRFAIEHDAPPVL